MAGICCLHIHSTSSPRVRNTYLPSSRTFLFRVFTHHFCFYQKNYGFKCWASTEEEGKRETPQLLKIAVSGVTEILRIFSSGNPNHGKFLEQGLDTNKCINVYEDESWVCDNIEDIVLILQSDYENAYFLTGDFTSTIYAEDCIFEDPTIKFRGRDLYARNLKLLVPFFDCPSLILEQIEKGRNTKENFVLAKWKLRTYLKLPWRPLISIEGSTVYDLDDKYKIVRHSESWNVSALEAVGQIFTPRFGTKRD